MQKYKYICIIYSYLFTKSAYQELVGGYYGNMILYVDMCQSLGLIIYFVLQRKGVYSYMDNLVRTT